MKDQPKPEPEYETEIDPALLPDTGPLHHLHHPMPEAEPLPGEVEPDAEADAEIEP